MAAVGNLYRVWCTHCSAWRVYPGVLEVSDDRRVAVGTCPECGHTLKRLVPLPRT